jgi:excisionase family DNA binding protein
MTTVVMGAMVVHGNKSGIVDGSPVADPRVFGLTKTAYSVSHTLDLLSIGRTTFYALVGRGELKITKLGRKSLVYATDIAALLTKLRSTENH